MKSSGILLFSFYNYNVLVWLYGETELNYTFKINILVSTFLVRPSWRQVSRLSCYLTEHEYKDLSLHLSRDRAVRCTRLNSQLKKWQNSTDMFIAAIFLIAKK